MSDVAETLDYLFEGSTDTAPSVLSEIAQVYNALVAAGLALEQADEAQKRAQETYSKLMDSLSEILLANRVESLQMTDGHEIGLKTTYYGSASQERMPAIREWLASQGIEGLAKPKKLAITPEDLPSLPENLSDKVQYEINTNSLKAFLNDLSRSGNLDKTVMELFAVYPVNTVIIK